MSDTGPLTFYFHPAVFGMRFSLLMALFFTGRKSMTDQLGDKMRPDSQKTATEKMGDAASGMGDRVAGAVQPEYVYQPSNYLIGRSTIQRN